MDMRRLALLVVVAATPAVAQAEDDFRHGRVRTVEGGVAIQRATEPGAEQATWNLPFLPGDRVWTDDAGRAEFQFVDGSAVRMDIRTKLDYVDHEPGRQRDRVILRLWSGGVYLHFRDNRRSPDIELETPGGVLIPTDAAIVRVDIDAGEARVSVYEGSAEFEGDRRLRLRAGERLYARRGDSSDPERFDRGDFDDFARWDADLEERLYRAEQRYEHLPEELLPYGPELEGHGAWYFEADVGHVWRPYVGSGWRPYFDGRWAWTPYGWTWVPYERWGWAPSHYGRWGHSVSLGWYWIPGRRWGPAWVSWAYSPSVVGWCPLGYRDRPVIVVNRGGVVRGRAVPRGSVQSVDMSTPWTYVNRSDITAHDLARRRVQADAALVRNVRVLDVGQSHLTRDLQPAQGARAVPRVVRTKPTMGDTVPELRTDPATTIPLPVARQRRPPEEERPEPAESVVPRRRTRDPLPARLGAPAPRGETQPGDDGVAAPRGAEPVRSAPASGQQPDVVAQPRLRGTRERPQSDQPAAAAPREAQRPSEPERSAPRLRREDTERRREEPQSQPRREEPERFRREPARPEPEDARVRPEPRAEPERFSRPAAREPERFARPQQREPERPSQREPERIERPAPREQHERFERPAAREREPERRPEADPGREVLRPIFRPLAQPRQDEGQRSGEGMRRGRGGEGEGPRPGRPEAVAPRQAPPPPQQQPAPQQEERARRRREKQ
jgi:hypothetical protein